MVESGCGYFVFVINYVLSRIRDIEKERRRGGEEERRRGGEEDMRRRADHDTLSSCDR